VTHTSKEVKKVNMGQAFAEVRFLCGVIGVVFKGVWLG